MSESIDTPAVTINQKVAEGIKACAPQVEQRLVDTLVEKEVVQPTEEKLGTSQLIARFLEGENGSTGDFHSSDNALYEGKNIIARRARDGSILLPKTSVANVELNDELIGQLFSRGCSFRRIDGFNSLTNSTNRVAELRAGQYDDFKSVAKLFNFEFSDNDFSALDRAKAFTARVTDFFNTIHTEEQDRIRSDEEKARAERAKASAIAWDTGSGRVHNFSVHGEGGGQRLRLSPAGTRGADGRPRRTDRVETSTGHTISLASAKRAFDFASRYWHGGEEIRFGSVGERRSSGGYRTTVTTSKLQYGCQHVTRREAERFADTMNWERAKPSV